MSNQNKTEQDAYTRVFEMKLGSFCDAKQEYQRLQELHQEYEVCK